MPRWLRVPVTLFGFCMFFLGSPLLGLIVFPLLWVFSRNTKAHKHRITRLVNKAQWVFTEWMRRFGIIEAPASIALPAGIDLDKPYVLVSNHPTLIDTVLILGWFDQLTCVAKGDWYRSIVLGPLLRQTEYLPSPRKDDDGSFNMLERMVRHLGEGKALLVFPEGTRSEARKLNRFRRGAIEAAIRAKVPIVPMFLGCDRTFLMKGWRPWQVPSGTPRFFVEVWEPLDLSGADVDSGALNAALQSRFQARFDKMLREERIPEGAGRASEQRETA